jgi:hypothetical protein
MCGEIGNEAGRQLNLDERDESTFSKAVMLGCWESITGERGREDLIALGRFADQYQIEAIQGDVEEAAAAAMRAVEAINRTART